jgi:sigma-B regulation protein RsbU (phosphoserine phosphatase)
MRILAGWDDPAEAELLQLYLAAGEANEVSLASQEDVFLRNAEEQSWDVIFQTLTFPDSIERGMAVYTRLQEVAADTPIVLACRPSEIMNLPRFLLHGLRFYLFRDAQGDFMFLVQSVLESAVLVAQAERAQRLAEQLQHEIEGVRTLQEAIIPRGLTPPAGYRASARYEPAQVSVLGGKPVVLAGGDYYDLFCPDSHTLTALIGDASGHGLKACLSIMTMHTLVRMLVGGQFRDTAGFVAEINRLLCENSIVQSGGGFITLLYASIDTDNHRVSWASAGHPLPLLHQLDTNEVTQVGSNSDGGPPLGIAAGMPYDSFSFTLPPHSRLLLYTDGLTDALSEQTPRNAAFGVNGICTALRDCLNRSLDETLDHLFEASHSFTEGKGRHDDTSVLLLERDGD